MKSVVIVDDHPVTRFAVKTLLEKEGMKVIGETDDGIEALSLIRKTQPDLVVVDIDINSMNGVELVQRLRNNQYAGGVLIVSPKPPPGEVVIVPVRL